MTAEAKEDRRIQKSLKQLNAALHSLLQNMRFKDITICHICDEALVGRTTFYSHFTDKYDFLKSWFAYFWPFETLKDRSFNDIALPVNQFFRENETLLINLFGNSDSQVSEMLVCFLCSAFGIKDTKLIDGKLNPKYVIAENHFIYGIVGYVLWQVNNCFPEDMPVINEHIFSAVKAYRRWELEDCVRGDDIMTQLTQIKKLQQSTDKGLQYLVDEAYKILENPIIVYDMTGKVLAHDNTNAAFWGEYIRNGSIRDETIKLYELEGASEIVTNPNVRVTYLYNEHLNHHINLGKVFDASGLLVAFVVVVSIQRSFNDTDLSLVAALCNKVFSIELEKKPDLKNNSLSSLENNIVNLIDGEVEIKASTFTAGYTEMIYKGLKSCLYVAVADVSQCNPTFDKLEYFKDMFKQVRPAFKYAIYSNYIVIIMSTDARKETFNPKVCLNRLSKIIYENNIKVGISSEFENLYLLPKYYAEAMMALETGKTDSRENIYIYSE